MAIDATIGEPITIRYDGMDAERHSLELMALGESVRGLGRIISVAANFAATQKFIQHQDAMEVRVLALPPKAHCFELLTAVQWINQSALASTTVGGLTVALVSYIFAKLAGNKAEMKELRGALETAIKEIGNRDQKVVERLLDTVDKMAASLRPAAKQAVTPIGRTASTLSVDGAGVKSFKVGIAERDAIEASDPPEISEETTFRVRLHEMNMDTATCKVSFSDEPDERTPATITDPVASLPRNPYAEAFAAHAEITVKGKVATRDGKIEKLYISDVSKAAFPLEI